MLLVILCVAWLSYFVAKSVNRSLRDCSPSCSSRRGKLSVVGIALKAEAAAAEIRGLRLRRPTLQGQVAAANTTVHVGAAPRRY
jgi:hypothetical protein